MIIMAAHDGVQAIVNSPEGHLMRTVNDVFIRVDVVLGAQWLSNDEVLLYPMVNEMDWLNSAGMLATFWKEPIVATDYATLNGPTWNEAVSSSLQLSAGYKVAQALFEEVMKVSI